MEKPGLAQKKLFSPAKGARSTFSLVEIHNKLLHKKWFLLSEFGVTNNFFYSDKVIRTRERNSSKVFSHLRGKCSLNENIFIQIFTKVIE